VGGPTLNRTSPLNPSRLDSGAWASEDDSDAYVTDNSAGPSSLTENGDRQGARPSALGSRRVFRINAESQLKVRAGGALPVALPEGTALARPQPWRAEPPTNRAGPTVTTPRARCGAGPERGVLQAASGRNVGW
jgi:hypothetical protein